MKINFLRSVLSGAMVWSMIFILFIALSMIPHVKDNQTHQIIIVGILLIPFSLLGATFYYKKGKMGHGIILASIMAATGLLLDACITVPLLILPTEHGSYSSFYADPFLWVLIAENVILVTLYKYVRK